MYPLTVGRADTSRLEMPIVKVDVHAPIFYFPKIISQQGICKPHCINDKHRSKLMQYAELIKFKERWGYGFRPLTFKQLMKVSLYSRIAQLVEQLICNQ